MSIRTRDLKISFKNVHYAQNGKIAVLPSVFFALQDPNIETNASGILRMRVKDGTRHTIFYTEQALGLGLHYRIGDAIISQLYYEINNIGIGISYDINLSSYTPTSKGRGGIECSIKNANFNGGELYKCRGNPDRLGSPIF